MLTAALITMFAIYFGGSPTEFFLNPDMKKSVNKYVVDKPRQKEIHAYIKQIEKDQKNFSKRKKKYYQKNLTELNHSYNSTRKEFDTLYTNYLKELEASQTQYWEGESKIRELITEDEWNNMMTHVLAKPEKDKARKSFGKASEKVFGDISKACDKIIADSISRTQTSLMVSEQKSYAEKIINEYLDLDYQHLESLRNKNASADEFKLVTDNLNSLRMNLVNQFTDLRFTLVKQTSEDEWKKLAKELDKIYSSGTKFAL